MDNEVSAALNMTMTSMNIKYQLVPPSNHRPNNAEKAITTLKNHFIVGLCSVDEYFHIQIWGGLLLQSTISLNFLRQSITLPHLSAYTQICGGFNYNLKPLAPPGTRVVIHNRPNDCTSWAPPGEDGWYIRPEMEHYRFHKAYTPKTIVDRISDTVEFPPK